MRVSIIIPAYNAVRYLSATVESVLAQTVTDWEMVIVDDGSTDETLSCAKGWAEKDSRIRYIHQANAGVSAARNRGFAEVHADYIAFLDADDVWEPDALETLLTALEKQPAVLASYGLSRYMDAEGHLIRIGEQEAHQRDRYGIQNGRLVRWPLDRPTTFEVEIFMDYLPTPGIALVRHSALEKAGLFDSNIRFWEDWDLWLRICLIGDMAFVNKHVLRYRIHESNVSHNSVASSEGEQYVRRKILASLASDVERRNIAILGAYFHQKFDYRSRWKWAMQCLRNRQYVNTVKHLRHFVRTYLRNLNSRVPE